mmetsp:Transcript_7448/g.11805  ORF Transcript_7448/g.11805 Transcript_7448/m.11805 type:complete len:130 (-) Transcript_7448:796-1185(-)
MFFLFFLVVGYRYLSDFGMARVIIRHSNDSKTGQGRRKGCEEGNEEASSSPPTSSLVIPYPWSAPETLSKLEFSIASDVYMFGCMMYEIVFQTKPWRHKPVLFLFPLSHPEGAKERSERRPAPNASSFL